jgi:hypothetical protein
VRLRYVAEKTGAYGEKVSNKTIISFNKKSVPNNRDAFFMLIVFVYCASEIRICTPARVVVMGGEVDIFGSTRLCSKYNFKLTRLLIT